MAGMRRAYLLGLSVAVVAGCGGDEPCETCVGGSGGDANAAGGGSSTSGWTTLIDAPWQLEPFSEHPADEHTLELTRDIVVGGIRPIAPKGTHHTLLRLDGGEVTNTVYASGVGTNELMFPPGVGLRLRKGQLLRLELHLFNPQAEPLSGSSGIEVVELDEAEVEHDAEIVLAGPLALDILPNAETTTSGTCTVESEQRVFALFPHMHQLGTHFKTTLTVGGTENVLHDAPYAFDHQAFYSFDPIAMAPGDTVESECTWVNPTSNVVGWGESSEAEMCFSILYRYPAGLPGSLCVQ
jgi:hypothetical protein